MNPERVQGFSAFEFGVLGIFSFGFGGLEALNS